MGLKKIICCLSAPSLLGIFAYPPSMTASNPVKISGVAFAAVETTLEAEQKTTTGSSLAHAGLAEAPSTETTTSGMSGQDLALGVSLASAQDTAAELGYGAADMTSQNIAIQNATAENVVPSGATMPNTTKSNTITISGRSVTLVPTGSTTEFASFSEPIAWHYGGGQYIYGHNSGLVFDILNTLYDNGILLGQPISVSMNGTTITYVVTDASEYTRNTLSWLMSGIVRGETGHKAVLQTCRGDNFLIVYLD
ncbi:hypothetical protein IJ135_01630 [Candidatus Saccharibacteria bacterium]|nr:hypothetical protein [Candidatus Saccharibacteria bacterium]